MRLQDRVKKLERGGNGITPPTLFVFLTDGEAHQLIIAASADNGKWRVLRKEGECEDAFMIRVEDSVSHRSGGLITVMLERAVRS